MDRYPWDLLGLAATAKAVDAGVYWGGNRRLFNMLSALPTPPRRLSKLLLLAVLPVVTSACSTWVGPSRGAIEKAPATTSLSSLRVLEITDDLARRTSIEHVDGNFAANLGDAVPVGTRVGVGDALEVAIWVSGAGGTVRYCHARYARRDRSRRAGRIRFRRSWSVLPGRSPSPSRARFRRRADHSARSNRISSPA